MQDKELLPHQYDATPFEGTFATTPRKAVGKRKCIKCGKKTAHYFRCQPCLTELGSDENLVSEVAVEGFRADI